MATVETFLQANNCPELTKNTWLFLKKNLPELSTTQSTPSQDEILKRHSSIDMKLFTTPVLPPKASTYVDSACFALAYSTQEYHVPIRALKAVLVNVLNDFKLS
jgi:hypothetical protein